MAAEVGGKGIAVLFYGAGDAGRFAWWLCAMLVVLCDGGDTWGKKRWWAVDDLDGRKRESNF